MTYTQEQLNVLEQSYLEEVKKLLMVKGTYSLAILSLKNQLAEKDKKISELEKKIAEIAPKKQKNNMATILFNEIPLSNPDLVTPGRGAEQWHDHIDVNVPTEGIKTTPFDVYYRTTWNRFEGATENSWNFDWIRTRVTDAISKKQTFHFGIMSVYVGVDGNTGGVQVGGNWSAVPKYLIDKMQTETPKSWVTDGNHIPNWNSSYYHSRCLALNQAINNWIQTTTINGVPVKNVIGIIDIRLYGNWGEWHSAFHDGFTTSQYPSGTFPTGASLKKIVDAHTQGFPNNPLVAMIAAFDANWLNNTNNPPEIADYILNKTSNAWGPIGWRRDQWGATDQYLKDYLENNNRSFGTSGPFKGPIMNTWTKAPVTGEPPAWNPGDYFDLERQIKLYHAISFGNGNYGVTPNTTIKNRVRAASKICGYRFKVISATTNITGSTLQVNMNWQNIGNGNCWQDWNIEFELVGTNWKGISKHKLKFFQPMPAVAISDSFGLTGVPAGSYALRFSVKDPNGYRVNMALAIQGGDSSNHYSLGTIQVGATPPPVNIGPTAKAGGDIEITLPVNSAQLNGSGSDPDGVIVKYEWKILSGSGTLDNAAEPITMLRNLTTGTTALTLTVTDDKGASGSDDLNVKINPTTPVPPIPKKIKTIDAVIDNYIVIYDDNSQEIIDA